MGEANIVEAEHVYMRFNLAKEKVDNLKEYVVRWLKRQKVSFNEFYALRDVSFSIKRGESFAIIGENGSGKSTLLKAISGIYAPTRGSVRINGTIAPLIELGAGFDMDLTARENIFLNGAVLGYDKKFIESHFKEIMDFAELWDFVDVPVKNFSSGMVARLGFSIATVVVPDILIVDEILAVGDFMFQQKCEKKMHDMLEEGTTLIFVSHSIQQVRGLCKKAVWLKHGIVQMVGEANEVCDAYVKDMESGGKGLVTVEDFNRSHGTGEAKEDPKKKEEPDPARGELSPGPAISLLLCLSSFLMLWANLGPGRSPDWLPARIVEKDLVRPLAIAGNFGMLATALVLLTLGFSTFYIFLNKKYKAYFKNLFFYIGSCLVTVPLFYLVQKVFFRAWDLPTEFTAFTARQWVLSATFLNFFVNQPSIFPVSSISFNAVLFCLLVPLFFNPNRQKGLAARFAALELVLFLAVCLVPAGFPVGDAYAGFVRNLWPLFLLLAGGCFYLYCQKEIGTGWFLLFSAVDYYALVKCMALFQPEWYEKSPFLVSAFYAYAVFALVLVFRRVPKPAEIGVQYPLVLLFTSVTFGTYTMDLLQKYLSLSFTAVFLAGVLCALLSACGIGFCLSFLSARIFKAKEDE